MRIAERRQLHALLVDQLCMARFEPAIVDRLPVQRGAGVGRGQRHLDGVRIDLLGELDGLLDRLAASRPASPRMKVPWIKMPSLRQSFGEAPRDVGTQALLDVVQDLVVARSRSRRAAAAGRCPSSPSRSCRARWPWRCSSRSCRARPCRARWLRRAAGGRVGEGVVVEHDFLHFGHVLLDPAHLGETFSAERTR